MSGLGLAELLQDTRLSDKQRRFVQAVGRSGETPLAIVHDILDFSKIEAGLPDRVRGDPKRLRQGLANLINNAVQFTDVAHVELRLTPVPGKPGSCAFSVSDTGIGIESELRRTCSPPSPRGGRERRVLRKQGWGSRFPARLAKLMGGRTDIQSRPGQGSTFRVELPLLPADTRGTAVEAANVTESCRLTKRIGTRILVVEDNAVNQEVTGHGAGFDGHLSKPFRQSQLHAMLTSHPRLSCPEDSIERGAAGAAPSASVLDEQALDRLRELDPNGENKLMERVVSAFETSVSRLMPQLEEAMASLQLAGIRHVAHTLKSSSASIGALELSRICADVEAMARQQQTDGMPGRVAELQAEVETVRVALKQVLNT